MNYDYLLQSFFIIDKRLRIVENFEQVVNKSFPILIKNIYVYIK